MRKETESSPSRMPWFVGAGCLLLGTGVLALAFLLPGGASGGAGGVPPKVYPAPTGLSPEDALVAKEAAAVRALLPPPRPEAHPLVALYPNWRYGMTYENRAYPQDAAGKVWPYVSGVPFVLVKDNPVVARAKFYRDFNASMEAILYSRPLDTSGFAHEDLPKGASFEPGKYVRVKGFYGVKDAARVGERILVLSEGRDFDIELFNRKTETFAPPGGLREMFEMVSGCAEAQIDNRASTSRKGSPEAYEFSCSAKWAVGKGVYTARITSYPNELLAKGELQGKLSYKAETIAKGTAAEAELRTNSLAKGPYIIEVIAPGK